MSRRSGRGPARWPHAALALVLALTLAPPDSVRRAPGGALVPQPVAGSFRIVTLEIVAALVGCGITEAREAVARCPVRAPHAASTRLVASTRRALAADMT